MASSRRTDNTKWTLGETAEFVVEFGLYPAKCSCFTTTLDTTPCVWMHIRRCHWQRPPINCLSLRFSQDFNYLPHSAKRNGLAASYNCDAASTDRAARYYRNDKSHLEGRYLNTCKGVNCRQGASRLHKRLCAALHCLRLSARSQPAAQFWGSSQRWWRTPCILHKIYWRFGRSYHVYTFRIKAAFGQIIIWAM